MTTTKQKVLPYVLIRTYSAGVHCGELVSRNGKEVTLRNARRIWYWRGANTLNEIANNGVGAGSKVSETLRNDIVLTEAIEVLTCTSEAQIALRGATWAA